MGYRYDAFISYRHLPADIAVAEKLQVLLETKKKKDGNKLSVFRDKSDLPTSGNLGGDIYQALEESRFLIIICSPQYQESEWCMAELRYFRQLHGNTNANILPILVEGEPEEAFPAQLFFAEETVIGPDGIQEKHRTKIEPLGADVRGKNDRERLKKLKIEHLRVAAPILGVRFDDLYQRQERRQRMILGLIIAALVAFCVYSAVMIAQINTRQKKLEAKQLELYQKEATRIANTALEQAGENTPLAMLLANAALPVDLDEPEYTITAEAERAIKSAALQHQSDKARDSFTVNARISFDSEDWTVGRFYAHGKYLAVYDYITTWLYETHTGQLLATLPGWEQYFFGYEEDTGKIWVARENREYKDGEKISQPYYGYLDSDGNFVPQDALPWELEQECRETGIDVMNTEHNASMWSMILGDYQMVEYDTMPEEYRHILDAFAELEEPYEPYEISITPDGRLALIQTFDEDDYQLATAFWAVEEDRLLWICPDGCFWEEESGRLYRIMENELQILTYNPENFNLPTDTPRFEFVSDDGAYGFVTAGDHWKAENYCFVYQINDLCNALFYVQYSNGLLSITPDGRYMALVTLENELWVVDIAQSEIITCLPIPEEQVKSITICDDGKLAAYGVQTDSGCEVVLVDTEKEACVDRISVADFADSYETYIEIHEDKLLVQLDYNAYVYDLDVPEAEPWVIDCSEGYGFADRWDSPLAFTDDGLLLLPTKEEAAQGIQKRIKGIYDVTSKEQLNFENVNSFHREDFFYDDKSGTLIVRNGNLFTVERRGASGDFETVYTIRPQHNDMELKTGGHGSDGTWLLLQNEEVCEIYRLEDGNLCYVLQKPKDWKHQYALIDGCLHDFQAGWSQGIPLPSMHEARNYVQDVLKGDNVRRVLTQQESQTYYIMDEWQRK